MTLNLPYLHVLVMLHAAFAGVFFFMNRQRSSRMARLFAWSWAIEAVRAAILLPAVHRWGGMMEAWFSVADVLCFVANWCLLAGCADIAGVRLPRWLAPAYLGTGIPLVLFNRYGLPPLLEALTGLPQEAGRFRGVFVNMLIMFVPVSAARVTAAVWLFQVWRKTRLPGALVAALFGVPFAAVAFTVPFQYFFGYTPGWWELVWNARVLGFSIGLVMLMFSLHQATLVKSEASLAAAQALAKLGSWELDVKTRTGTWSAEMFRLYRRDPTLGVMSYEEFLATIHPEDREAFVRGEEKAIAERRSSEHEFRIVLPDGSVRWIQGRNTPLFDAAGTLVRMVGTEQEVTERKRAESRMELQHAVTRVLAEAGALAPTMLRVLEIAARAQEWRFGAWWLIDRTSRTLRCAGLWHRPEDGHLAPFATMTREIAFGPGEGLPGRVWSTRGPVTVADVVKDGNFPRRTLAEQVGLHGGVAFPILQRDEALGVVEFFSERLQAEDPELPGVLAALGTQIGQFMERLRLEEQYRQSQKMEAVGTLAGGIAHDFNNILTAISGYTELAKLEAAGHPAEEHLNSVHQATRRAIDLVRQILTFSQRHEQPRSPVQLQGVVTEALKLLRATIPTTIEIKVTCDENVSAVLAEPTAIHQVIVNLGTNAWHAMKDRSGRIEVSLENVVVDEGYAQSHPGLQAGNQVRLGVSDTGRGMDEATLARIFEPFFTTKEPGQGTGLGLAVVHGIVERHGGAVVVQSRPEKGTRFFVYFPAHEGDGETPDLRPGKHAHPSGRGERILYVDDEAPLARMGKKILERLGYEVDAYDDPSAALEAFRVEPADFELVVTDLTMPSMTGLELARDLLAIRPELPIILTSGYTAQLTAEKFREMGIREFLLKPHSVDSLGEAVRRALAARA